MLPSRTTYLGGCRAIVPLNTVYYIAAADPDAHVLAAYFNFLLQFSEAGMRNQQLVFTRINTRYCKLSLVIGINRFYRLPVF